MYLCILNTKHLFLLFSDRRKRPDMQIYVPRARRGTQKNCLPIQSKLGSESVKCSIDENNLVKSDEHPLCSDNKSEKDVQVSQLVSKAGNTENYSPTKVPRMESAADRSILKNDDVGNNYSCVITCDQILARIKGLTTPSSIKTTLSFTDSETEISDGSYISENNSACSNETLFEKSTGEDASEPLPMDLPNSRESTLSFQDTETEITHSFNISEDNVTNSNENTLKKSTKEDTSKPIPMAKFLDKKIVTFPQINTESTLPKQSENTLSFQNLKTEVTDTNIPEDISAYSNENLYKKCTKEVSSERLPMNKSADKKIEFFPQIVTENILPNNSDINLSLQDSSIEITNFSNDSKDVSAHSNENLSKSIREETLPITKSSECPYQEKEDSWESKFDDDGECLNPEIFNEVSIILNFLYIYCALSIFYVLNCNKVVQIFSSKNINGIIFT